jgi:hypothetical protein
VVDYTLRVFLNRQSSVTNSGVYHMNEIQKSEAVSVSRRDFCKKAIKRSSVAAAAGAVGYIAYKKPAVRSFFGAADAYAASTTAAGKFTLKGDSN